MSQIGKTVVCFFNDVGMFEVFDQTRLIPRVAPAKPIQMHAGQVWSRFRTKDVGSKLAP